MALIPGNYYDIKMWRGGNIASNAKLIQSHDTTMSHEIQYTFITQTGMKIQLTRSLVQNSVKIINTNLDSVTLDFLTDTELYG